MPERPTYHHGDLPATLVRAAIELLDADGVDADLSLRAVARTAGVSTGAPYRHFTDRNALLSAVAAVGYRDLAAALAAAQPQPATVDELADVAVAYVRFAITRPGLFRVMFGGECDLDNDDRVAAVSAINSYLESAAASAIATEDPQAATTGAWALVHGLAFLYLDGKLTAGDAAERDTRVRSIVAATMRATVT